jgi:hypothetical protein
MRAGRKGTTARVLAAFAAATLLAGCVVPGASFGTEPLQTRFAEATRLSLIAQERPTPPARATDRSAFEPVVLAHHTTDRN